MFPASRVSQLKDADLFETFFGGAAAIGLVLDRKASIGGYFVGHPSGNVMTWDFLDPTLSYINHGSRWVAAELSPTGDAYESHGAFFTGDRMLAFRFAGSDPDTTQDYIYNRLDRSRVGSLPSSAVAIPCWGIWSDMTSHITEPNRPVLSFGKLAAISSAL